MFLKTTTLYSLEFLFTKNSRCWRLAVPSHSFPQADAMDCSSKGPAPTTRAGRREGGVVAVAALPVDENVGVENKAAQAAGDLFRGQQDVTLSRPVRERHLQPAKIIVREHGDGGTIYEMPAGQVEELAELVVHFLSPEIGALHDALAPLPPQRAAIAYQR